MTKQYDNNNSGIVFVQTEKKSEKWPDYNGSVTVDGKDYWVSGWKKFTAKGEGISLALKPREAKPQAAQTQPTKSDYEDDIPW